MEGIRRQYSKEFKKEAIGHSLTSEKIVAKIAHALGIVHSNLRDSVSNMAKKENYPPRGIVSKDSLLKKKRLKS
jgi:transposase-like protein